MLLNNLGLHVWTLKWKNVTLFLGEWFYQVSPELHWCVHLYDSDVDDRSQRSLRGRRFKGRGKGVFCAPHFSLLPVPGSEIVGSAELRKRKHENKTRGNWKLKLFPTRPTFRLPFSFESSPLSESLEQTIFSHVPNPLFLPFQTPATQASLNALCD